jgi:signal transduction histidine kinase
LSRSAMALPPQDQHAPDKASASAWSWDLARNAGERWNELDLARQFMLVTSIALILGMQFIGYWVSHRIGEGIIATHGVTAALYAESFVESRIQELATKETLSADSREALDRLILPQAMGQPIVGFRIWKGDTVVYSDKPEYIGKVFPPTKLRDMAWNGRLAVEYEDHAPDHGPPLRADEALLEIYIPIRRSGGSNDIIALAETYQIAPELKRELRGAKIGTWIVVAGFTISMLFLQFMIVLRGSRTITEQRGALNDRITELSRLLEENSALRHRAQEASRRVAEMNEQILRRIGSDLHDGPVQVLGMSVLRLDSLRDSVSTANTEIVKEADVDISALREGLRECLAEIRNLSSGLAPADIDRLNLTEALRVAAQRHERHTGTHVNVDLGTLPEGVSLAIKSCFFRLVQEGLTNAFRHAEGIGQQVTAQRLGDVIEVAVLDRGPGVVAGDAPDPDGGMGLAGLRDRVESLGGEFEFGPRPDGGMRLVARLRHVSQTA